MEHHTPHTIASALAWATGRLGSSATPRLDAELLLADVLGWSRARVLAERRVVLDKDQWARFAALVARRENLEPIAYILGRREFYGLLFEVTPATLDPRPETELVVDLALRWTVDSGRWTVGTSTVHHLPSTVQVADIGTGTGCIAIAFAVHCPQAQVMAVDLSPDALAVATRNVARYDVADRVQLAQGDLLEPIEMPIDLLLSNPPYTVLDEIDENVFRHEPHGALDGGPDGLYVYRRLLAQAPSKLAAGGAIILEIGATQSVAVSTIAVAHFPNARISTHKDLAGLDRVVMIET